MSAVDDIREAAALMRERAQAAKTGEGPWTVETQCYCDLYDDAMENGGCQHSPVTWNLRVPGVAPVVSFEAGQLHRADFAAHIASWSPAVALLVADWLDATAREFEALGITSLVDHPLDGRRTAAYAVARAYLGRAS